MLVPLQTTSLIRVKPRLGLGTDRAAKLGPMAQIDMTISPPDKLTIGRMAKAAEVGVETVRYYQRRGLLPVPRASGAVRYYPVSLVQRIGFIKKAQALGFSLKEIGTLVATGKLKYRESVAEGIASAPEAFFGMLKGRNFGKQLVKLV